MLQASSEVTTVAIGIGIITQPSTEGHPIADQHIEPIQPVGTVTTSGSLDFAHQPDLVLVTEQEVLGHFDSV